MRYRVPLAILIGGLIIGYAVYASMGGHFFGGTRAPARVRPVSSSDHILGNPAARIVIVEYADFEDPYSKNFHDVLHELIANDGASGQIAWAYREFPLRELHPNADAAARAAECAAEAGGNGAFWTFADLLYANQPADSKDYGAYATKAGADSAAFTSCYTDAENRVDAAIRADRENALSIGADGTPFSVVLIPGKPPFVIDGAYSYDVVKQMLAAALNMQTPATQ